MEIKCKKDLYNAGKCFTKGETYEIINLHYSHDPKTNAGLIDKKVTNDLGEDHLIGGWWRHFKLL